MRKNVSVLNTILTLMAMLLLSAGCAVKTEPPLSVENMDVSIKPGEDFYRYVNGAWIDKLTIPDDKSRYSVFDILREERDENVRTLLREVSQITDVEKGSITQKIRHFYATGMDTLKIDTAGLSLLHEELELIDKVTTKQDVQDLVARFHTFGLDPLFEGGVEQDFMDSKIYKFMIMQAGVGLPDVEYYTKEDDRSVEIRAEYVKHIARMFELLGDESEVAASNAEIIMDMETRLAEHSKTRLEMRDIPALYNKKDLAQLLELSPEFDWEQYFSNITDLEVNEIIVFAPAFLEEISRLMVDVSTADWKTYLRWNLINRSAEYLSRDFVNQDYRFYSEFLSGSKEIEPRWQRVVAASSEALGEPLGQLYVKKYFPPESKERMVDLVDNLRKSMEKRIRELEWMSESTKEAALEKLAGMNVKIGYPDKWEDFSKLKIETDSYLSNVRRANYFHYYKELDKLPEPVDLKKWSMTPQTVNAGYHPLRNDITFPAAILQPPFFNPDADDAVNYGSIGVVIGHEMTHGFDDQGRHFDKDGNMRDWWSETDTEEFNKRTHLLVEQYDAFVAIDDVHINGKLTLGENIADFGGLSIALEAYRMSLEGKPEPEDIDGLSDEQRFFMAFVQIWRGKIRDKALIRLCQEDVHPWGKFRANGAPFNVPEFYDAFDISPEDPLYRSEEQRPVIW